MSCRVIILHPKVHVCNFPPHFEYFPLFLHFVLVIVFIMCLYFVYLLVVCIFCISYLLPYFVFVLVFSFIERYAYPFYISLHFMCIFYILQICNVEPCDACAQLPFDVRIPLNHYFVFVFVLCIFLFYVFPNLYFLTLKCRYVNSLCTLNTFQEKIAQKDTIDTFRSIK